MQRIPSAVADHGAWLTAFSFPVLDGEVPDGEGAHGWWRRCTVGQGGSSSRRNAPARLEGLQDAHGTALGAEGSFGVTGT